MKLFLIAVSTALLCSQAEGSYLGVAQGTPLGGFSQHRSFHGGFIPGGLYGNGAGVVNHGLSGGYLPGPIYGNGGYLDYAYGSGKHYGNGGLLKYLYGNRLGLGNLYSSLGNVRTSGINDNSDDGSSTSGSESVLGGTDGADLVSGRPNLGSIQSGVFGLPSSPVAAFGLRLRLDSIFYSWFKWIPIWSSSSHFQSTKLPIWSWISLFYFWIRRIILWCRSSCLCCWFGRIPAILHTTPLLLV
ncbi:uncharacterized protein LOC122243455 [Penaeus japonicus]|uniref:uncharacterized protein LOC122243455 n=1 Tax=Penaeus japonicus TaxID=27405 RepID=UPI001C710B2A|nr:uncharacterized protein LOC122243455 [Penaeus japonicus]